MENQQLPPDDAAVALGLVSASRSSVADRLVTPTWYHPALGLLGGVAVVGYGTGSAVLRLLGAFVLAVGAGLLVQAYKRQTGVWVSGHRPGPARRYAVVVAVVLGLGMLGALGLRAVTGSVLPSLPLAAAVVLATVVLGRRYDDVLRADLRGQTPSR